MRQMAEASPKVDIADAEPPEEPPQPFAVRRQLLKSAEEFEISAARHLAVDRHLGGQIPDPRTYRDAVGAAVAPLDERAPAGGPHQVQQNANGRCLPRAIGPQKAVHLAAADREIEILNPDDRAVVLRQRFGPDRVRHREWLSLVTGLLTFS